jgi:type I restriction enzyme S subunit
VTEITNLPELPKGWTWIKIKDMCDVRGRVGWRGYKKTDLRSEGPYVIGATHLSDDFKLDLSSPVFISKEKYFESPEIMANQGDIIIAQRGSLGKLGIVDFDIGEATINPCVLLMKNIKILNTFLLYLLASPKYNNILIEGNKSTTTPMITQKFIKNFIVPIPPFNEQKRIVSKIEELFTKLDVGVKEFKSIKKKLDVYRKSVLKNAFFNKLIKLETSWKDYEIKDISEKIQYGLTSNSSMGYGGSKYLRITDIQNRKVDWKSVPFAKKTEELDKYYLKDGDLVFARTGATVGKSFLIKDCPKNAVFASYLIRITPDLTKILPELLWYYFQSPMYWEQITELRHDNAKL